MWGTKRGDSMLLRFVFGGDVLNLKQVRDVRHMVSARGAFRSLLKMFEVRMKPYQLINRLGSGGFVLEAGLTLADIPFDYAPLESLPNTPVGPLVKDVNPWHQVPVMITPDEQVLTEVAAMILWLCPHEPTCAKGPQLWVEDPIANHRWAVFMSANIYEAILRYNYPARYIDLGDVDQATQDAGIAGVRKAAKKQMHAAFHVLEDTCAGKKFLMGDRMSLCDIYLAMLYLWHRVQPDLPNCTAITHSVATHPGIAPIWHRNFGNRLDEQMAAQA